jgi:hypothetical protein
MEETIIHFVGNGVVAVIIVILWWRIDQMHSENKETLSAHQKLDADSFQKIDKSLDKLDEETREQSAVLARLDERTKRMNGGR